MKKLFCGLLLSCVSLAYCIEQTAPKQALSAKPAAEGACLCKEGGNGKQLKIGVVSAMEIGNAAESKDLQNKLQVIREKYEKDLVVKQQELQKIAAELQGAMQAKLQAKVTELQERGAQKQQELENKTKEAERGMQREAQKLVGESQEHFIKAVEAVATKQDLDLVLQKEQCLFVKKGAAFDITKSVVDLWNADFSAKKGATKAVAVKK